MTEQTEREALEALFFARFPTEHTWPNDDWHERFTAMLDAGAYESAALMMVDQDRLKSITFQKSGSKHKVEVALFDPVPAGLQVFGPKPATAYASEWFPVRASALCAAITAAIGGEHDPA